MTTGGPDPIALVEVAYRRFDTEHEWLDAVASRGSELLDRGLGVVAYTFTRSRRGGVELGQPVARNASRAAVLAMLVATKVSSAKNLSRIYFETPPCSTLSEFTGVPRLAANTVAKTWGALSGVSDFLVIKGASSAHGGVALGVFCAQVTQADPAFRARWDLVAAHLAAAHRLLLRTQPRGDGLPGGTEAVMDLEGRVVHAEGDATRSTAALGERVRKRARVMVDGAQALSLWPALVEARWSLTDHFAADGRRFVVARENRPRTSALPALTARERDVIGFTALGHTRKLIAYELGLSESSVRTLEARAMRKLGVRTRLELIKLFASTR